MKQVQSWIKHFNVPEPVLMKWQQSLPEGESLLFWALKQGHIDEEKYLQWASSVYEMPRIQQDYFNSQSAQNSELHVNVETQWRPDFLPLGQWDDIVYVACLQPETNFEIPGHKVVHVLSPVAGLQLVWAGFQPSSSEVESPLSEQTTTNPQENIDQDLQAVEPPETPAVEVTEDSLAQETLTGSNVDEVPAENAQQDAPNLDIPKIEVAELNQEEAPEVSNEESSQDTSEESANEEENVKLDLNVDLNSTSEMNLDFSSMNTGAISTDETEEHSQEQVSSDVPEGLQGLANSEESSTSTEDSSSEENSTDGDAPAGLNIVVDNTKTDEQPDGLSATASDSGESETKENQNIPEPPQITATGESNEQTQNEENSSTGSLDQPIEEGGDKLPPSPKSEWDFAEVTSVTGSIGGETTTGVTRTVEFTAIYSDDNRPICTNISSSEVEAAPNNFDQAMSFDDVAACAFKKMQIHFQKSMMLVFHSNQLIPWRWTEGWDRSGKGAPIPINLIPPSFFRVAFNTLLPYHGYITPSDVNDKFCMEWTGAQPPKHITLIPITMNGNVAGMILGSTDNLDILDYRYSLQFMNDLAEQIAQAYQKIKIKEAS